MTATARQYRPRTEEPAEKQAQIQLRLRVKTRKRLRAEAARREVSVNFLGERAIEQALDVWEKQKLA